MGRQESSYTIRVNAEISDLTNKVKNAKDSLASLLNSNQAPKGMIAAFEKIETLLGRIVDKAGRQPSNGLFSSIESDISSARNAFGDLIRIIGNLDEVSQDVKLELFSAEEQKRIKSAIQGAKAYADAISAVAEKEKAVINARKAKEKLDKEASGAKQNKRDIKGKIDKKNAEVSARQGRIEALSIDPVKNADKIARLRGEIEVLNVEITQLNREYSQASTTLTEANRSAKNAAETYNTLSTELSSMKLEKLEELRKLAAAAGVSIEQINGEDEVETMLRLNEAMKRFTSESLSTMPQEIRENTQALGDYKQVLSSVSEDTRQAQISNKAFNDEMSRVESIQARVKEFLGLAGATKVLSASLRQAFETTKLLDAAMTEIAVVTNFDVGDMWTQLPEYTARANDLGVSIEQAYKSSALFYQQGLKTNEVVAISNETLKMAKIAGLDAKDATDKMTAALRGFNMELNETSAQKVADVYSELAAITASDVKEISSAMTKTASIASSAGMEFETTAAFLSQIIETTRESAETAGTAMKTVIARFQELKKAPNEIGEVDGEIVNANAIEGALRTVGVSLRDASGQFRDLDDVFMELSQKWDSLDKNTQRYIATIAAGSRQQSRFIAMMSDYGRTQELVAAANSSAGASNRQFEKTMDSLEVKLQKLDNAWAEFSTSLLDSNAIKAGVDMLTLFVMGINNATSAFDGLLGSVSKIGMLIALFNVAKALFNKIGNKMSQVFTNAGRDIGKGIAEGIRASQGEAERAAQDLGDSVVNSAQPATTGESPESGSGGGVAPVKRPRGFKNRFGPKGFIAGGKKIIEEVGKTPQEIARGYKEGRDKRVQAQESLKRAKTANEFATNAPQQFSDVASGLEGAKEGADLRNTAFGFLSGNKNINAMALPLESIEAQFKQKMASMGAATEELESEWKKLYDTISSGGVTAGDALDSINESLDAAGERAKERGDTVQEDSNKITVDSAIIAEANANENIATGSVTGLVDSAEADVAGQQALINSGQGAMSNILTGNLGAEMSALALPLQDIEAQFKEKMMNMGASVNQVETEWKELYSTMQDGSMSAQEAIAALDGKLEEQAQEYETANGGEAYMGPQNIQNTANAKKETSNRQGKRDPNKQELEAMDKIEDKQKEVEEKRKEYNEAAKEGIKQETECYKKAAAGISNVGSALSMASVGLSTLGAKFSEMGLDAQAEAFNTMGSVIGVVGTALSFVGTIMGLVIPIMEMNKMKSLEQTGANTGEATSWWAKAAAALGFQAACWPVLLITLAIIAAIAILVVIIMLVVAAFEAAEAASPEGQLKAAEKAAERAGEKAEQAAEAYEALAEAFDELDGKYKALEELTKGTKEWNDAVRDINNSVIDLIEQYPELAKFVENKEGVLTIDLESEEVQGVLAQSELNAIVAKNASLIANNEVREKQANVYKSRAANVGSTADKTSDENQKALAQALTNGDIQVVGDNLNSTMSDEDMKAKYGFDSSAFATFETNMRAHSDSVSSAAQGLREFGDSLEENAKVADGVFESMAASAERLADTTGWSAEEIAQGQEMITGATYETFYNKYTNMLSDTQSKINEAGGSDSCDGVDTDYIRNQFETEEEKAQFDESFKALYGNDATIEGGKIKYKNADGDWQEEDLDADTHGKEIIAHMTNALATKGTATAMESTRGALIELNSQLAKKGAGGEIASRLFNDKSGGEMTAEDITKLTEAGLLKDVTNDDGSTSKQVSKDDFKALWDNNKMLQDAYGGNFDEFFEQMKGFENAATVFASASDNLAELGVSATTSAELLNGATVNFVNGLTKQLSTMKTNLKNMALSDEQANAKIDEITAQFSEVASSVPEHLKEQFQAQFSSLDLSNADAILGFKLDLIDMYNIEESAAQELADALVQANNASSLWYTKLTDYNALTGAQQQLESTLNRLTDLQWEYNNALDEGAVAMGKATKSIEDLIEAQVQAISDSVDDYSEVYRQSAQNMALKYADGAFVDQSGIDYRQFATIDDTGKVTIDYEKIAEYQMADGSRVNMESFNEWVDELKDIGDGMQEAKDSAKEQIEQLKELREETKESYNELRDLAKEAILHALEEQIALQEDALNANQQATQQLLSSVQNFLSEAREEEQNQQTEQTLADSLSKQAYLQSDTSGAGALDLAKEQKTYEELFQGYEDTLIDQALQELSDANEKAYAQRQQQISIMQQQLQIYQMSAEYQRDVDNLMQEAMNADDFRNTTLYQMLDFQRKGLSAQEQKEWDAQHDVLTKQANAYANTKWDTKISTLQGKVNTISSDLNVLAKAQEAKVQQQQGTLKSQGFQAASREDFNKWSGAGGSQGAAYKKAGGNYENYLNSLSTWKGLTHSDATKGNADSQYQTLSSEKRTGIKSRSEYYAENSDKIAAGENVASYESYIQDEYNKYYDDHGISDKDGMFPIHFAPWNNFQKVTGDSNDLDMYISTTEAASDTFTKQVSFGDKITDQGLIDKLNTIITNGYGQKSHTEGAAQGILYKGKAYVAYGGSFRPLTGELNFSSVSTNYMDYTGDPNGENVKKKIKEWAETGSARKGTKKIAYKTGGLADFTGPAWLDGTPSKPEYILNADQTERLFSLIDVLDSHSTDTQKASTGNNYFDIEINVEKLENDYDVEKIADKIRSMIYEDAIYRNVNAINNIR